jgi:hypothetical protein
VSETIARSRSEVMAILEKISHRPSCVDMGWKWEVRFVVDLPELGEPEGVTTGDGWLIRTTFVRPDTDTGLVETGKGGWHHVPFGSTESAIVKRAFVACMMILEHELREAFEYGGRRVFDPHASVEALTSISRETGR